MKIIDKLQEAGFVVKVDRVVAEHGFITFDAPLFDDRKEYESWTRGMTPCKVVTQVTITEPDGASYVGRSWCSIHDQFDRKLGITIAIGRAMKKGRIIVFATG